MITKIGLAHDVRNFFGETETRFEERNWNIERKHVLKAINYIASGDDPLAAAHFDVDGGTKDGGTHEVLYQDPAYYGTDVYTWVHWSGPNSKDTWQISLGDFKAQSREWMKG